jgi:hypothetical protein
MTFISPQTFDIEDHKEELAVIASVLNLLNENRYADAMRVLIARQDALTAEPKLKPYTQRCA